MHRFEFRFAIVLNIEVNFKTKTKQKAVPRGLLFVLSVMWFEPHELALYVLSALAQNATSASGSMPDTAVSAYCVIWRVDRQIADNHLFSLQIPSPQPCCVDKIDANTKKPEAK